MAPTRSAAWMASTLTGHSGAAGHSGVLLSGCRRRRRLVVFDKDPSAIAVARQLAAADPRVAVVHGGFATLRESLRDLGMEKVDGVMLDLGVSSPQLDEAARGVFFHARRPARYAHGYDARPDGRRVSCAEASVDEMREVIAEYGEERFAFQIAKTIAARRATGPLRTTLELAEARRRRRPHARKGAASGRAHLSGFTDLPQSGTRRTRTRPRVSSRSARADGEVGGDQLSFTRRPHGQAVHCGGRDG